MTTLPRPGAARLLVGVVALVLVVAAAVILIRQVVGPGGDQTDEADRSQAPTPSATGAPSATVRGATSSPTPGPDERPRTGFTRMTPTDSRLYNVMFARDGSSCEGLGVRRPPLAEAALIPHLEKIVSCLHALNSEALAAQDVELSVPRVKGFTVGVQTPCGTFSHNAFYCPQDQTIYLDTRADDDARFFGRVRLGYLAVITHEYGHHLQLMGGITDGANAALASADGEKRLEISRRLELQATCFSGVALGTWWRSLGASEADLAELIDYLDRENDDSTQAGTHGATGSVRGWFQAGFAPRWNAYARCDTWSVAPERVR